MKKVIFRSPGSFVAEQTSKVLKSSTLKKQIKEALEMSKSIKERFDATPYSFVIGEKEYFLPHCVVKSSRNIPKTERNKILISNCKLNGWDYIVETTKGWKTTQPFGKNCVLINEEGEVILTGG